MQFRRVIDNPEGICILHNDPGIAQNLEITEQKSELTITNLSAHIHANYFHVIVNKHKIISPRNLYFRIFYHFTL